MSAIAKTLLCASILGLVPVRTAQAKPAQTPSKPEFGIGYKAGNGVGALGADIIVSPISHLSFELQGAWLPKHDDGYAIALAVQGELRASGSTPYEKVGVKWVGATVDGVDASRAGAFINIGYEWKWQSGLGIQVGGGVGYLQEHNARVRNRSIALDESIHPNAEIGLRYRF
jgi:hypothetical protein